MAFSEKIKKILLERKVITEETLHSALEKQKKAGGDLTDILLTMENVPSANLLEVLSEEFQTPVIKLSHYRPDPTLARLIPHKIAEQYLLLPISKIGNILTIVMTDPLNILAIDDIRALTGFDVQAVIATPQEIREAIEIAYSVSPGGSLENILEGLDGDSEIEIARDEERDIGSIDLTRLVNEAPVVKITNFLLQEAIKFKASDLLIEPQQDLLRIRYRVDGILKEGWAPPKSLDHAIVSRLKVMANLNIAEHRLPQDGRFKIKIQNSEIDFRISVIPGSLGEKVALRVLDKNAAMLDIEKLGFEDSIQKKLKTAAFRPHGMILVCGPTGCGKTTTLYSLLSLINNPEQNLITVEDPVEYQIPGINQVNARPDIGLTFASALRSILRQDPDVIMIGEIRDLETVDIAIKAALTGHLVLSTLHTTTASGSIVRLVNMGVEPFLISSSVILVAAQRLVRKICQSCKYEYQLNDKEAEYLSLDVQNSKDRLFYKGKGCKKCLNTGYSGRVALMEVLELTPNIKKLISHSSQEHQVREAAKKEGMITLREDGLIKAKKGITTIEELIRVTASEQ